MPVPTSSALKSHLFYDRVPGSDTFAMHAAAFLNISRSIFVSTNSRLVLANSISISVNGLQLLPISTSYPVFSALSQVPKADGGNENLWVTSGIASFFSVTNFKASSRNAFVYRPCGVLSFRHFCLCILPGFGFHFSYPTFRQTSW
jgi:hypothetical protein